MSNLDWYQRKLASLRGGGSAAPQQRQQPIAYQQPQPQYQQRPQVQVPQYEQPQALPVTIENIYAAAGHWTGGPAHRIDREPCPECGGNQYFSRVGGKTRGPAPAPHCYNCGYNGMFDQGDPATWGAVG